MISAHRLFFHWRRLTLPKAASASLLLFLCVSLLLWTSPGVRLNLVRISAPDGNGRTIREVLAARPEDSRGRNPIVNFMRNQQISSNQKPRPVNPHAFKYLINNENLCRLANNSSPFLLTFVHTAPDHFDARLAIRNTWGNVTIFRDTRIVFMMGATPDVAVQKRLKEESSRFGDIVQETFHDSYRNLTLKAIAGLKWVTNYCRGARYVLKIDDDIFVNTFSLLRHLRNIDRYGVGQANLVLCNLWIKMKVVREPKSKWFISKSEFAEDFYPPYCSGSAYIMSTDIVAKMYNVSFETKFFWVDDFYITGLLAGKAGANYQRFNSVYEIASGKVMGRFTGPKAETSIFGHLTKNKKIMYELWEKLVPRMTGRRLPANWRTL